MSQTRNVCSQQDWIRVAFHAGRLVLWMSEKARRVVDDVRVVAVQMLDCLVRKRLGTGVVFTLHYFQQICNRSLRLFVHPCATTITLPLLVKIRFSLLLLSAFFFTLLSISIVSSPDGITSDDLMSYLSICARIRVTGCQHAVFLLFTDRVSS